MIKFNRWTPSAKQCYFRGCVCNGCFYNEFFKDKQCQMKKSVIELVKQIGAPERSKENEQI